MNIYIPDIKLPKDEPGAFQVIVMYVGADGKLRAECEGTHEVTIVPPHGRMIDADAVSLEGGPYEYDEWCKWALEQYQCAPTIIPADSKNIPDAIKERWAGIYFDALQTIIPASEEGE